MDVTVQIATTNWQALLEAAGYSNVQWRMLEEVRQMNLRTMGIEHDEGEVYVVWGYAPD